VGIREDLAAAKEHVADRVKTPLIPVVVDGKLHEVVFYRADPLVWSRVTMMNPPRRELAVDLRNGYNISAVARGISESSGRIVDADAEVTLTAEEWADFWEVIPPSSARLIEANVWSLHEHDTEQEIERAKKASQPRPVSRKKSS